MTDGRLISSKYKNVEGKKISIIRNEGNIQEDDPGKHTWTGVKGSKIVGVPHPQDCPLVFCIYPFTYC